MYEKLKLRKLLWLNHGHAELYGDDGEMQCQRCMVDFKRDPVDMIEDALKINVVTPTQTSRPCRQGVNKGGKQMHKKDQKEYCFLCCEETGNSGICEDSLYGNWVCAPPMLPIQNVGDQCGPFCSNCHHCLSIAGFIQ